MGEKNNNELFQEGDDGWQAKVARVELTCALCSGNQLSRFYSDSDTTDGEKNHLLALGTIWMLEKSEVILRLSLRKS